MKKTFATVVALVSLSGVAHADENHDALTKIVGLGDKVMGLTSQLQLASEQTFDTAKSSIQTVRDMVAKIQAHESALAPDDFKIAKGFEARASKWAADEEALLASEAKGREDVVLPLCDALWTVDTYRQSISREKANPSGVVNLRELHKDGEMIQQYEEVAKELKPKYVAFRHHAFTTWEKEGACVAENNKRD